MKAGIVNTGLSLADKGFNPDNCNNYILSIRIAPDGFFYTLFDIDKNKYIQLETFSFQGIIKDNDWVQTFRTLIDQLPFLLYHYNKIFVALDFPNPLLVPSTIYSDETKESLYKYNYYQERNTTLLTDELTNNQAVLIYPLSEVIRVNILELFPTALIKHQSSCLLEQIKQQLLHNNDSTQVFIQVNKSSFDLIVFKALQLTFFNSFRYNSLEDFLYFLLYALKNLSIDPNTQTVFLLGNIEKNSALVSQLLKYIRNIDYVDSTTNTDFSYVFEEIDTHQFFNLFNLKNCE